MKNIASYMDVLVQYQDTDFKGEYRLSQLVSKLSDLATSNAVDTKIWSSEYEGKYGWVLLKQTLLLKRPIKINELIKLKTRAGSYSRVQFSRYYEIYNQEEKLGTVFSLWTFIDLSRRRIARPNKVGIEFPDIEEYQYDLNSYQEIKEDVEVKLVGNRTVLYSDIDVNLHMNNARYIEWALDSMPIELLKDKFISEISMNYRHEIAYGTTVNLHYGMQDNYFKVVFTSEDNETVYFELGGYLTQEG